jgi:hypothetical protein
MDFEVIGDITGTQTIATGSGIRELGRLRKRYGRGASVRVSRKFGSDPAKSYRPSYTGMKLLVSESAK